MALWRYQLSRLGIAGRPSHLGIAGSREMTLRCQFKSGTTKPVGMYVSFFGIGFDEGMDGIKDVIRQPPIAFEQTVGELI